MCLLGFDEVEEVVWILFDFDLLLIIFDGLEWGIDFVFLVFFFIKGVIFEINNFFIDLMRFLDSVVNIDDDNNFWIEGWGGGGRGNIVVFFCFNVVLRFVICVVKWFICLFLIIDDDDLVLNNDWWRGVVWVGVMGDNVIVILVLELELIDEEEVEGGMFDIWN